MKIYKMMLGVAVVAGLLNVAIASDGNSGELDAESPKWLPENFSQWNYQENRFMNDEEKWQTYRKLSRKMDTLVGNYGLWFMFSANCKRSREMAIELKRFEREHLWPISAFSVDGTHLDEFPDAEQDPGLMKGLKIEELPVLVAVKFAKKKGETPEFFPIAYGITSHITIMKKLADIRA
ncbi:MAG: conjugal transfer protein TraF [Legionellales bacterium]|nr:conjugal transfer protein TraF [Legionellales bacterium]